MTRKLQAAVLELTHGPGRKTIAGENSPSHKRSANESFLMPQRRRKSLAATTKVNSFRGDRLFAEVAFGQK